MKKIVNSIINELGTDIHMDVSKPRYYATRALNWQYAVTAIIRPVDGDYLLRVEISRLNQDGRFVEVHNKTSEGTINWSILKEMLRDSIKPYLC